MRFLLFDLRLVSPRSIRHDGPRGLHGDEGLDVPGIWRNGGLSYADHDEERRDRVRRYEQRAAGIGNTEMMNVYERSLPTKPARLTALGKRLPPAARAAAMGLRAVVWIDHLQVLFLCAK